VLTDERFSWSCRDLSAARAACDLPALRKVFVIDPYQCTSRAAWVPMHSVIVAALSCANARAGGIGCRLGMAVLAEVHDRAELDLALSSRPL